MFSDSVVKDWLVIGTAATSFILALKFLILHVFGGFAPTGLKTTVAAA